MAKKITTATATRAREFGTEMFKCYDFLSEKITRHYRNFNNFRKKLSNTNTLACTLTLTHTLTG